MSDQLNFATLSAFSPLAIMFPTIWRQDWLQLIPYGISDQKIIISIKFFFHTKNQTMPYKVNMNHLCDFYWHIIQLAMI